MILTLIRRALLLVRGPVRRFLMARGRRPAWVVIRLKLVGGAAHMSVAGVCRWWASEEDVRAELARAWGAARRKFRRRHPGHDVALGGAVRLTHSWEWRAP